MTERLELDESLAVGRAEADQQRRQLLEHAARAFTS